jgi:hypothetical protein
MQLTTTLLSALSAKAAEYFTTEVEAMPAVQKLDEAIDCALLALGVNFTTEAAWSNGRSLVKMTMCNEQADVYRVAFPELRMDADGNYTADASRWA